MDLYKALSLKVVDGKVEPDVWVRRLVIYEKITPEPLVIREVGLTKGLNIVWAEEPENDNPSAEITGHSAGKTTFCRLLRYVLGEKTYGTKANMEMIRRAFPGGYVAAEVFVRGTLWAVTRPIGNGRSSYVKQTATIEELLADRKNPAYQDDYPKKLGLDALLDDLETGAVVRTGETIQWGHILAWCTRDQEARFQSVHDWRSPRSESEWPAFRFSKADPLFVMRVVMGLFLPVELKGEEELAKLQQDQEKLERRLEELKREPQFCVNLYDGELRRRLKATLPEEPTIDTAPLHWDQLYPDLHHLTNMAAEKIEADIAVVEDEQRALQEQIDAVGGRISQHEGRLSTLDQVFNLDAAGSREINQAIGQRQQTRKLLDQYGESTCLLGDILYSDCERVQRRKQDLKFTQLQDAQAMEQAEAKRANAQRTIDAQKQRLKDELARLGQERQRLQAKRDTLVSGIRDKRDELRALRDTRQSLEQWIATLGMPGTFGALQNCQTELKATADKIETLESQLAAMLEQHGDNRRLLVSIFSGAVRTVLPSGSYDGRVNLHNRELDFRITHGPAMSGEAVETLSVLLADVACLIYNSVSEKARLPGLLLHDSPREADLGLRIYRSFIHLVAALQSHFGSAEKCPFQYILTTTTPPPPELQPTESIKLRLNAAVPNELFLRRNVAVTQVREDERLI